MASRWLWSVCGLLVACSGDADGTLPGDAGASSAGAGGGPATVDAGTEPGLELRVEELGQSPVAKIDLLFMIDNSISMSDKQQVLQSAVPDLVSRLVNPVCVDAQGNQYPAPAEGASDCPQGQTREFKPIQDINIGIVSSSLGDVGANVACPSEQSHPQYRPDRVDMAHLLGSLPRSTAQTNPQGFLEWRAGSTDLTSFTGNFQRMVSDVGESGCGWEASLESWYRFLIDPVPYRELVRVPCPGSSSTLLNCVQPASDSQDRILLDETLLAQRAAFLRDDSLVALIMLSDENDCSAVPGPQNYVVFNIEDTRPMFKGSAACASDPNAKCCYSCPLGPPAGCPADPACTADDADNRLTAELDGQNLRCYQQKRRFGVDFLYPTQRYVHALTRPELCWNTPDLDVAGCPMEDVRLNPLFAMGRSPSLVLLGGIVGVPWQALASDVDASGQPLPSASVLRFKTYDELTADGVWAEIVGSPGVSWRPADGSRPEVAGSPATPPTLAQMVETPLPRPGVEAGNALNGRDYDTAQGTGTEQGAVPRANDLQYACILPLAAPRDCAQLDPNFDNCDCYAGDNDRPLCEQTPGVSAPGTTQYWAKAYPGVRELQVLKDFGEVTGNSVVASICARNVVDEQAPDYGYRPAIGAIVAGVKERVGDRCLPRELPVAGDGSVPCTLLEVTLDGAPDSCPPCEARPGRVAPSAEVAAAGRNHLLAISGIGGACLCELEPVQELAADGAEALRRCREELEPSGLEGWCYVDPARGLGSAELVASCAPSERRRLRFVGSGLAEGAQALLVCPSSAP